jgi:hypothetical protein
MEQIRHSINKHPTHSKREERRREGEGRAIDLCGDMYKREEII